MALICQVKLPHVSCHLTSAVLIAFFIFWTDSERETALNVLLGWRKAKAREAISDAPGAPR